MPKKLAKKRPQRRRSPVQGRGQATVEVILEAAAQILARRGPAAATTNAVAARAGVSIGTLYQYFADRDALIAELVQRHVGQLRAVLAGALAELAIVPLPEAVDRLVAAILAVHRVAPKLHQALHQALAQRRLADIDAFELELEAMVARVLTEHTELEIRSPELVATVLVRSLGGMVRTTVRREPELLDDPAVAAAMRAMILGTLAELRARS